MAPEVFRNEEYDTKVDVFSFALILHEVMLLSHLFSLPSAHKCSMVQVLLLLCRHV